METGVVGVMRPRGRGDEEAWHGSGQEDGPKQTLDATQGGAYGPVVPEAIPRDKQNGAKVDREKKRHQTETHELKNDLEELGLVLVILKIIVIDDLQRLIPVPNA